MVDPLEQVLMSLRRVIRATDLHSKHLAKTSGLTAPQILLLQAVRKLEGAPVGQLAKEVSLSQATVTSILDRLEKKGYVERERSQIDKRKVHVQLTGQGNEMLNGAPQPLQAAFSHRFSALQEWEQTMIIAALQRVASMMDAEDIDASPVLDIGALDRAPEPQSSAERPD